MVISLFVHHIKEEFWHAKRQPLNTIEDLPKDIILHLVH